MSVSELVQGVKTTLLVGETVRLLDRHIYLTYTGMPHPDTFSFAKAEDDGSGGRDSYSLFFPTSKKMVDIYSEIQGKIKHGLSIASVTPEHIILEYLGFAQKNP